MTLNMRGCAPLWPAALCVACVLAIPAPAHAQAPRVTSIDIRGNRRINDEYILTVVTTKVGDEVSPERLARDRAAIEALGFFSSVLVPNPVVMGSEVQVIFVVQEFPEVKAVEISGGTLYKPEQIRAAMKTKQAEMGQTPPVFNLVNWEQDLDAIDRMYKDKGYLIRLVHNVTSSDPGYLDFLNNGVVRLEIHELKVGKVAIKWPTREKKDKEGNVTQVETHKTRPYVVLRELKQRPGVLYNQDQIGQDYRSLSNLGFFESINPVRSQGDDLDTVSITWELTEKRTGQISVGAGYSPRQHLLGRAELSDQNFRGKGQAVSIWTEIGSFGGDGAPSVELQFYEPWLTSSQTSMNISVYNKLVYRFSRELSNRFDRSSRYHERRFGGQVTFGRPFRWPVSLGMRFDDVRTSEFRRKLDFPQQDGQVIAGSVARLWNSRDYANTPTEGSFIRLFTEFGHASLDRSNADLFDNSFFDKLVLDARRYYRLRRLKAPRDPEREQEAQRTPVIALRLMAGTTFGDIPFFEQYFMGGAESLRGYLEDRFWGRHMFLASAEYRRPIYKQIMGVLFVDVGDAWGTESVFRFGSRRLRSDFDQHDGFRLNPSVGVGLRVATPIGPIRLDFGYGREGGRTHFSFGHAF